MSLIQNNLNFELKKVCKRCGQENLLDEFIINRREKKEEVNVCRKCRNEYYKKINRNPERAQKKREEAKKRYFEYTKLKALVPLVIKFINQSKHADYCGEYYWKSIKEEIENILNAMGE